jgi:hypothetical protein
MTVESAEQCLAEAAECDRLATLARSTAMRQTLLAFAFKWRALAEAAARRERSRSVAARANGNPFFREHP